MNQIKLPYDPRHQIADFYALVSMKIPDKELHPELYDRFISIRDSYINQLHRELIKSMEWIVIGEFRHIFGETYESNFYEDEKIGLEIIYKNIDKVLHDNSFIYSIYFSNWYFLKNFDSIFDNIKTMKKTDKETYEAFKKTLPYFLYKLDKKNKIYLKIMSQILDFVFIENYTKEFFNYFKNLEKEFNDILYENFRRNLLKINKSLNFLNLKKKKLKKLKTLQKYLKFHINNEQYYDNNYKNLGKIYLTNTLNGSFKLEKFVFFSVVKYILEKNNISIEEFNNKMIIPSFKNLSWNECFGGKEWYKIAKGLKMLYETKTIGEKIVAIDHIYDLQHHNDFIFDKIDKYNGFSKKFNGYKNNLESFTLCWLKKILDFKTKKMKHPFEIFWMLSPKIFKLLCKISWSTEKISFEMAKGKFKFFKLNQNI